MATRKLLSLTCEIPNFANAYLGKVTKFQGYSLFLFWSSEQFTGLEVENTTPGMNRVNCLFDTFKNHRMFSPLQGVDSSISIGRIERRYESLQTYDRNILYI